MGVMQLSAICKTKGHATKLAILKIHSLPEEIRTFHPDMVAYSAMSADEDLFTQADEQVKLYMRQTGQRIIRIMGGPHPTYFPSVLKKMKLDAVCLGEGDHAISTICDRISNKDDLRDIPNVLAFGESTFPKEIIHDLDALPFVDRDLLYDARPELKSIGLRTFLTSRGCPYSCTYCFNHSYNKMFRGCGNILRRRSVDNVISEIKYVISSYPSVEFLRFGDDTFIHKKTKWLEEFAEKYRKEIHLPFYCLMRSNTLTEDVAKILADMGCKSIGMSLESGDEHIRNKILKRHLSDDVVFRSFAIAHKYNFNTLGGTILGVPGVTLDKEFKNIFIAKQLKITVPLFNIFAPYPKLELTEYAVEQGFLDASPTTWPTLHDRSILNCFSEKEKNIQQRLQYLGTLYCVIPFFPKSLLLILARMPFPTKIYAFLYSLIMSYLMYKKITPGIHHGGPLRIIRSFSVFKKYWSQGLKKRLWRRSKIVDNSLVYHK